jgi:hypothetical protein
MSACISAIHCPARAACFAPDFSSDPRGNGTPSTCERRFARNFDPRTVPAARPTAAALAAATGPFAFFAAVPMVSATSVGLLLLPAEGDALRGLPFARRAFFVAALRERRPVELVPVLELTREEG